MAIATCPSHSWRVFVIVRVTLLTRLQENVAAIVVKLLPHLGPGSVEYARSVSWLDDIKDDLNQSLFMLGLVLHMLVVFSDCCFGLLCCYLVVVIVLF